MKYGDIKVGRKVRTLRELMNGNSIIPIGSVGVVHCLWWNTTENIKERLFGYRNELRSWKVDSQKPKLLDLFCCAGGATKGYQRAGFYVVGVDIKPQPHYCGDEFHQGDALTYPLEGFDAYHASPPCQGYSVLNINNGHPMLILEVRAKFIAAAKPYVIENVEGAKQDMVNPLMLCGTMFGLKVRRHRLFESNPPIYFPPMSCNHSVRVAPKGYAPKGNQLFAVYGRTAGCKGADAAMGIDWTDGEHLAQAIPPAYTEYIGKYLIQEVWKVQQALPALLAKEGK